MMRSKAFSIFFILFVQSLVAQVALNGVVTDEGGRPIQGIEVYLRQTGGLEATAADGSYSFTGLKPGTYTVVAFGYEYEIWEQEVTLEANTMISIQLEPLGESLNEVLITKRKEEAFALRSLKKVEGTAIYAGKKTEVVSLDVVSANLAANVSRQIYGQVAGLNIYENGDAGLQLNIGGRGLDPNRSANFNIRQNQYDISADVLGYPESYYTPPAEALQEIQVIRGAASLQYGTQFGGLINFKFREPNPNKPLELISRQTVGSYGLFTSFNSLSGTKDGFSYYTYFNYKEGDGWRPNSQFNSRNFHVHLGYEISDRTRVSGELTLFNYLAKQAGGLTDAQFLENPEFSNRARNWFDVDWLVYSLRLEHDFSTRTSASLQFFGLDATRSAVGFRTNRVSQPDDPEEPRELLVDDFGNWGLEGRALHRYDLMGEESALLLGFKYYKSDNQQQQGPGSTSDDPDFSFATADFPFYERQSEFEFPNENVAIFGENIFQLTDRFSVTPGFRYEYIKTESMGAYKNIVVDLAGNVILDETIPDNRSFERDFVLLGLGMAYDLTDRLELYGNFSQNYRSVTFNDIRVVNPSFVVDEDISDEEGFTVDVGLRGNPFKDLRIDLSVFGVRYDQRLGEVLFVDDDNSVKRLRGNIGDAFIFGGELYADWNTARTIGLNTNIFRWSSFLNLALIHSEYINSQRVGVEGNEVEFIPDVNLKAGFRLGWKDLGLGIQYSYIGEQFTDATNAPQDPTDNQRGIEGSIPAYGVLDVSASYTWRNWRLEAGVNNLLDESYFTRRATGYPGPGIIPADPLSAYTTLQFKF